MTKKLTRTLAKINIVAKNFDETLGFYRLLGIDIHVITYSGGHATQLWLTRKATQSVLKVRLRKIDRCGHPRNRQINEVQNQS